MRNGCIACSWRSKPRFQKCRAVGGTGGVSRCLAVGNPQIRKSAIRQNGILRYVTERSRPFYSHHYSVKWVLEPRTTVLTTAEALVLSNRSTIFW